MYGNNCTHIQNTMKFIVFLVWYFEELDAALLLGWYRIRRSLSSVSFHLTCVMFTMYVGNPWES